MQIDSITQRQLDLLFDIVTQTPLFSVAIIPEDHKNYEAKGRFYQQVADDIVVLQNLGFVDDITGREGSHNKIIKQLELTSGYTYYVYVVNKMGILMYQEADREEKKETAYKYSIN